MMKQNEDEYITLNFCCTEREFPELIGKTMKSVTASDDEMTFVTTEGRAYHFHHYQDCCEDVHIDDICGDLNDLVGHTILKAEEVSSDYDRFASEEDSYDSYTWTFYKFATIKGYVDVRWLGQSNGYYSEGVDFEECETPEQSTITAMTP